MYCIIILFYIILFYSNCCLFVFLLWLLCHVNDPWLVIKYYYSIQSFFYLTLGSHPLVMLERHDMTYIVSIWHKTSDIWPMWNPGLKVIKLSLETSLKSQASNWLKWRLVAISANQMFEIWDWFPCSVLQPWATDVGPIKKFISAWCRADSKCLLFSQCRADIEPCCTSDIVPMWKPMLARWRCPYRPNIGPI